MKILILVPSHPRYSGVDYHRLVMPHNIIGHFNDDIEISMINEIDSAEIPFLSQFDFLVCNRFLSRTGDVDAVIAKLKAARLRYIVDLDDDYKLPHWHLLYANSLAQKHAERIIKGIKGAYAITTTHERLAATINLEIKHVKYGIVPNGILPIGQFEPKETNFDKVHLGWSGSITHFEDVLLMHDALKQIYLSDLKDSIRVVHGGYDGTDVTSQAIAGVLSAKGLAGPDTFQMYPARDVVGYAEFYDHVDISLIPLRDNRFNNMKSNLKLLEAGFKRKAVIVSDVYPYSPLIEHGKNCLAVKGKNDWYKHMKSLIESKELRNDLADQLFEDVQDYHLERVANERLKFYKSILSILLVMALFFGCKKEEPIKRYKFVVVPIMNQSLMVNGEQKSGFVYSDSLEVGSQNTFTMSNKAGECLMVIIVNDSIIYEMRSKNSITTQIKI